MAFHPFRRCLKSNMRTLVIRTSYCHILIFNKYYLHCTRTLTFTNISGETSKFHRKPTLQQQKYVRYPCAADCFWHWQLLVGCRQKKKSIRSFGNEFKDLRSHSEKYHMILCSITWYLFLDSFRFFHPSFELGGCYSLGYHVITMIYFVRKEVFFHWPERWLLVIKSFQTNPVCVNHIVIV